MKDKPIVMSAPMVRALLAGRKSQTRRVMKLPTKGIYVHPKMGGWEATTVGGGGCFTLGKSGERVPVPEVVAIWHQTTGRCIVAPYQIGRRLWVREAVRADELDDGRDGVRYLADDAWRIIENTPEAGDRWSDLYHYYHYGRGRGTGQKNGRVVSPIHMPRWASRITLTVTSVRVERLQDISANDCYAEGCARPDWSQCLGSEVTIQDNARGEYRLLWDTIHGPGAWALNPWVCAIGFEVDARNIDAGSAP